MSDHAFDRNDEPEKTELVPASAVARSALAPVVLRPGPGVSPQLNVVDPMALLNSFRRRWPLAIGLGILAAAVLGGTAWLFVPPLQYTSTSLLKVLVHPPRIIFGVNEGMTDYGTFQRTQAELIRSRLVLGPVLRDKDVAGLAIVKAQADPLEWLEKTIGVDFSRGSELLRISMTGKNPDELKPIVDAVVTSYMDTIVEEDHTKRVQRLEELRKLMSQYQSQLKVRRATMREMGNRIGSEDRSTMIMKQQFMMETMHGLERELHAIESDLRHFNIVKDMIEKQAAEADAKVAAKAASSKVAAPGAPQPNAALAAEALLDARVEADPGVITLVRDYEAAKARVVRMKRLIRDPSDPAMTAARTASYAAHERLNQHRDSVRDALLRGLNTSGGAGALTGDDPQQTYLERFRERMAILERNRQDTSKEIDNHRQALAKLNKESVDLQTEQDEYQAVNLTLQQVAREVETLTVELQAPRRITVLGPADPPRRKDASKIYMMCGGASFGGFALAILAVSFWEMKAMRIGSVEEVVNNLGLALVGTLPALPSRTGKQAKDEDQRWQGLLVESIDATRTMLLHAARLNATRAVMITSAMKGEGKTSLAAHLATSLARAGRKTLLIDCDLRRPTLHQLFDVARVPGICELLRGEAEINDVIRPTPADDLNLMPAGHCDGLALQAIAQDGFRDVLTILKKRYDFIIIDSAPVLPVVDTMLLAQQVDGVLFSIMREVSRVPAVHAAHERLASLGVRMLGAVVSAATAKESMHSYDYEYQNAATA